MPGCLMAEPTPGPWTVDDQGDPELSLLIVSHVGEGERLIGTAFTVEDLPCEDADRERMHAVCLANAQLLAAAPRLLVACRALRMLVEMMARGKFVTRTEFTAAVEFADAALARLEASPNGEAVCPQRGDHADVHA